MVATVAAPARPFMACIIRSPRHGERFYSQAQLQDAFADIAKAKAKRTTLLAGIVGSRDLDALAPSDARLAPHPHNAHASKEEKLRQYCFEQIAKAVQTLCSLHDVTLADLVIVSGGARGVDRLARDYAEQFRLPCIEFAADWDNGGKGAGYARNAHIARVVDELVAWPRKDANGEYEGGTMDTVRRCRELEKPVTLLA